MKFLTRFRNFFKSKIRKPSSFIIIINITAFIFLILNFQINIWELVSLVLLFISPTFGFFILFIYFLFLSIKPIKNYKINDVIYNDLGHRSNSAILLMSLITSFLLFYFYSIDNSEIEFVNYFANILLLHIFIVTPLIAYSVYHSRNINTEINIIINKLIIIFSLLFVFNSSYEVPKIIIYVCLISLLITSFYFINRKYFIINKKIKKVFSFLEKYRDFNLNYNPDDDDHKSNETESLIYFFIKNKIKKVLNWEYRKVALYYTDEEIFSYILILYIVNDYIEYSDYLEDEEGDSKSLLMINALYIFDDSLKHLNRFKIIDNNELHLFKKYIRIKKKYKSLKEIKNDKIYYLYYGQEKIGKHYLESKYF